MTAVISAQHNRKWKIADGLVHQNIGSLLFYHLRRIDYFLAAERVCMLFIGDAGDAKMFILNLKVQNCTTLRLIDIDQVF